MQAPSTPIVVRVIEENEITSLGNVMLEAIGLTGAITLGALLFGLLLAAMIIGYRTIRAKLEPEDEAGQTQSLGLTPPAHR